jgi:hypothetical protein
MYIIPVGFAHAEKAKIGHIQEHRYEHESCGFKEHDIRHADNNHNKDFRDCYNPEVIDFVISLAIVVDDIHE